MWHGLVAWCASVLAQRRVHVSPGPYSSIWELMLAEKLEPRILGSWVPVRGRRTVRAEVSGPASVSGASLRQPSPKTFCGLTRRGSLCHRGWGHCSEDKSRL